MNLNNNEKKAIVSWTSTDMHQYRYIKSIIKGDYNGPLKSIYAPQAKALLGLFDKYTDNTNSQTLYRGDVIENDESNLQKYTIGKVIVLEESILSFTLSQDVAIKSYMNSDKNIGIDTPTVLYILTTRKSTFLDISKYSQLPHEKEVLCNKGLKFLIAKIERQSNHLVCYLNEV